VVRVSSAVTYNQEVIVRPNPTWLRAAAVLLLLVTASSAPAAAQDPDRPLLSQEIRTLLERDGIEAARNRFEAIFPAQKDKYEIDMQGMAEMGAEYMQAGDYQRAEAVMQMVGVITQNMAANSGMMQAGAAASGKRERAESKPSEPARGTANGPDFGPTRDDLARFAGVYGDPDQPDSNRKLFVSQSCEGHLVAGAMWGDAQNWWMRSVSDNAFEMSSDFLSLRLEFQLGPDGNAQAVNHDLDFIASPLQKLGPLPEGWEECLRPPGG
jgi:hypothetical protein